jgi:hypothetical protein
MNDILLTARPYRIDRYEAKFVIPVSLIEKIEGFIAPYCSLDKYSTRTVDHYYRVNNLYFDTDSYLFLHRRLSSVENRFNMRIRTYSDETATPCFFEIKQKQVGLVRKHRAIVEDGEWPQQLAHCEFSANGNGGSGKLNGNSNGFTLSNRDLFVKLALINGATPKVLTQYKRKAYVSDINDYARVTFDRELRYRPEEGYNLIPGRGTMTPLDNSTIFDQDCEVILELKCYSSLVPFWMIDLIRQFHLNRCSFSKYVTGISEVLQLNGYYRDFRLAPGVLE